MLPALRQVLWSRRIVTRHATSRSRHACLRSRLINEVTCWCNVTSLAGQTARRRDVSALGGHGTAFGGRVSALRGHSSSRSRLSSSRSRHSAWRSRHRLGRLLAVEHISLSAAAPSAASP
eukprot:313412-Rhodomonas_salina.2